MKMYPLFLSIVFCSSLLSTDSYWEQRIKKYEEAVTPHMPVPTFKFPDKEALECCLKRHVLSHVANRNFVDLSSSKIWSNSEKKRDDLINEVVSGYVMQLTEALKGEAVPLDQLEVFVEDRVRHRLVSDIMLGACIACSERIQLDQQAVANSVVAQADKPDSTQAVQE